MKIRTSFVSNSSSSSFIIKKTSFTDLELDLIRNFVNKRTGYYATEIEEETDIYIKGDLEAHNIVIADDSDDFEDKTTADNLFEELMWNMKKKYGKDYIIKYEDYVFMEDLGE